MNAKSWGSGDRISTYRVLDDEMAAGSTLGAPKGVVVLKADGSIERFYSIDAGAIVMHGMQTYYWDPAAGAPLRRLPGAFVIHPDLQEHECALDNGLLLRERVFMLNGQPERERADPAVAYVCVTIENPTHEPLEFASIAACDMRADLSGALRVRYESERRAIVVANDAHPQFARAFACSRVPSSWEVTSDHGKCSRIAYPGPLASRPTRERAASIGLVEHHARLEAGATWSITYRLACATNGARELHRVLDTTADARRAAERTRARYDAILHRAAVVTPDATVNRGVLWAKANMLRTQILAPTGWCFVNDPTRSNNSVGRDTAWFSFGSDYVTPDFSRESLLWYLEHLERGGMVVEYYDVRTGKSEDYGLNVNDNTPLLILAAWHHFNATGDATFLERAFAPCRRAANFILTQRDKRGLIFCSATGTADWGIAGWRNVIAGYRISGAVTELNSECYAALRAVSRMAARLGKRADADRFERAATALRDAINEHLLDPQTGLYYLTIDVDGTKRTEVTCDLVFPVMFGVADEERAAAIVSRLTAEPFWTEAGIRTVPRDDINYGPTHGYGLLGGVWVGVTFWYAFAASRFNPAMMADALNRSFRHYSSNPRQNNTVPGQFSEWLHGETLVNQGMMLSPWFPPRYLWAAIEGAAGLDLTHEPPSCNPRLAPDWRWLGVRNLRFRGKAVSWFVVRTPELAMYTTFPFESALSYQVYDGDRTEELVAHGNPDDVTVILLQREGELVIFLGNTADRTVTTSLRLLQRFEGRFATRTFNSLRGSWVDGETSGAELHRGIAVEFERRGFALIELRPSRV